LKILFANKVDAIFLANVGCVLRGWGDVQKAHRNFNACAGDNERDDNCGYG